MNRPSGNSPKPSDGNDASRIRCKHCKNKYRAHKVSAHYDKCKKWQEHDRKQLED